MEQKINWIIYLFIGISLITVSCEKKEELNIKTTYIYKNNSDLDLTLEVFNKKDRKLIDEIQINKLDSILLVFYGDGIPSPPFFYDSNIDSIGDSISVIFDDNKYLFYTEDTPHSILDNRNYQLNKQSKTDYRCNLEFTELDYQNAKMPE